MYVEDVNSVLCCVCVRGDSYILFHIIGDLSNHIFLLITGNTEMSDAMETIFQAALAFGKHGGVIISFCYSFLLFWTGFQNASLKCNFMFIKLVANVRFSFVYQTYANDR